MTLTIAILAAGRGTRMCSSLPKVKHCIGGQTLLHYSIQAAKSLNPQFCYVVASPQLKPDDFIDSSVAWAIQETAQGTGDAVRVALEKAPEEGHLLVLLGDTPLIRSQTLQDIVNYYQGISEPALVIVGMRPQGSHSYGRILTNAQGHVERIIEAKDAQVEEQHISLCNSGVLLGPIALLRKLVQQLQPRNQAQEYYLTDCIALAHQQGIPTYVIEKDSEEFSGINTRAELAVAEKVLQNRWRQHWLDQGVTLVDPASVFFCYDTKLAADVTVEPYVTFGPKVHIHQGVHIFSFCHIENSEIGENATIGPFAHLREGNKLGPQTSIGNFVEVKHTTMAKGAKAKHLSYLGDMTIGQGSNIGAGTINCNYDGFKKFSTFIGDHVFIGSHTTLVAPVRIEDGAMVAAGSVVNQDVPKEALAVARQRQLNKPGWSKVFREKQQEIKK